MGDLGTKTYTAQADLHAFYLRNNGLGKCWPALQTNSSSATQARKMSENVFLSCTKVMQACLITSGAELGTR